MSTRIISYNLNGIRAAHKKGLYNWLEKERFDLVCFQETKALPEQIETKALEEMGYHHFWFSAQKKGYSGVGILSLEEPQNVEYGCGIEHHDYEGRMIRADFKNFSIISAYFPSGTSGDERQDFKYQYLDEIQVYLNKLRKKLPKLVVAGDYNIANHPIDIHNPVSNKNSSGFLPEERAWLEKFWDSGFEDSFRHFNKEPHHYSWWSFRANARANNKGWRIDYHGVSQDLMPHAKAASIYPEVVHSDHCPIYLELDF